MLALRPEQIGAVMGMDPAPSTYAELEALVSRGISKASLRTSVAHLVECNDQTTSILHRIVPEGTLKRRKEHLSPEESERTERLARVFATAAHVLESEEDARSFLHKSHPMLENRSPLDVSFTEIGAQRVERILWAAYYGLVA